MEDKAAMNTLDYTIHEALENAPPDPNVAMVLDAVIRAREHYRYGAAIKDR